MADDRRRRAENVRLLQEAVSHVLSTYERYKFIDILNSFQRKKDFEVLVRSLRELLNSSSKQELIPYLLGILSLREREKFLKLWMKTSTFKVYYADGTQESVDYFVSNGLSLDDKFSSVCSVKSLPVNPRATGVTRGAKSAAWRARRLEFLRAERDKYEPTDKATGFVGTPLLHSSMPARIRENVAEQGINGLQPPRLSGTPRNGAFPKPANSNELRADARKAVIHPSKVEPGVKSHFMALKREDKEEKEKERKQRKTPTRIVYLSRDKRTNGFGLSIRGSGDQSFGTFVSAVESGSPSDEMGLNVGDQLLAINDASLDNNISHADVVKMILSSRRLKLEILSKQISYGFHSKQTEYQWINAIGRPCSPPSEFTTSHMPNGHPHKSDMRLLVDDDERKVNLIMDSSNKIGLKIRGGKEYGLGIYVAGVDKGSVAEKAGLKVGDQILDINGTSFLAIIHAEAASLIKSLRMMTVTLRDVGKVPFATTVYSKSANVNKRTKVDPLDSSRWLEVDEKQTKGGAIFRQGIAGSQLMHQAVVGVPSQGLIEEQGRLLLTDDELVSLKYYVKQYSQGHIDVHGLVLALLHILNAPPKMALLSEIRSAIHPQDIDAFDEMVLKKELAAQKHRIRSSPTMVTNVTISSEPFHLVAKEGRFFVEEETTISHQKDVTVQTTVDNIMEQLEQECTKPSQAIVESKDKLLKDRAVKYTSNGSQTSEDSGIGTSRSDPLPTKPLAAMSERIVDSNYEVLTEEDLDTDDDAYYAKTDVTRSGYQEVDNYLSSDENENNYGVTRPVEIQLHRVVSSEEIGFESLDAGRVLEEADLDSLHSNEEIVFPPVQPHGTNEGIGSHEQEIESSLVIEVSHIACESFESLEPCNEESPYAQLDLGTQNQVPCALDHLRMALSGANSDEDEEEGKEGKDYVSIHRDSCSPPDISTAEPLLVAEIDEAEASPSSYAPASKGSNKDETLPEKDEDPLEKVRPSFFLQASVDISVGEDHDSAEAQELPDSEAEPLSPQKQKPLFFVPFGFKGQSEQVTFEDMMVGHCDDKEKKTNGEESSSRLSTRPDRQAEISDFECDQNNLDTSDSTRSLSRSSSGRRQMHEVVDISPEHKRTSHPTATEQRPYSMNPAFSNIMRIPEDYISRETKKHSAMVASQLSPSSKYASLNFDFNGHFQDRESLLIESSKQKDYKTIQDLKWNPRTNSTCNSRHGAASSPQSTIESIDLSKKSSSPTPDDTKFSTETTDGSARAGEVSVRKIKQLFESKSRVGEKTGVDKIAPILRETSMEKAEVKKTRKTNDSSLLDEFEFRPSSSEETINSSAEGSYHSVVTQSSIQDLDLISYSGTGNSSTSSSFERQVTLLSTKTSGGSIVKIDKSFAHLGLVLEGDERNDIQILKVKSIQKGKFSAAFAAVEESNVLHEGQEILAVDGESLEGLSHSIANLVLRQAYNNPDGRYMELLVKTS